MRSYKALTCVIGNEKLALSARIIRVNEEDALEQISAEYGDVTILGRPYSYNYFAIPAEFAGEIGEEPTFGIVADGKTYVFYCLD